MTPSVDTPQGGCLCLFVGRCILCRGRRSKSFLRCVLFFVSLCGNTFFCISSFPGDTDAGVQIRTLKTSGGVCIFFLFLTPSSQPDLTYMHAGSGFPDSFCVEPNSFLCWIFSPTLYILLESRLRSEAKGHRRLSWDHGGLWLGSLSCRCSNREPAGGLSEDRGRYSAPA